MPSVSALQAIVLTVLAFLVCGILPLVLLLRRVHDAQRRDRDDYGNQIAALQQTHAQEITRLTDQHALVTAQFVQEREELTRQRDRLQKSVSQFADALSNAESHIDRARRLAWLHDVSKLSLPNKYEVEIRIAYQLLRMAGYQDSNIVLQEPVDFQFGQNSTRAYIDFLAYLDRPRTKNPFLLLQIASPSQDIDAGLMERVRTCAFQRNCSRYLVTNGRDFIICERQIPSDHELLVTNLAGIVTQWDDICDLLRPQAATTAAQSSAQ